MSGDSLATLPYAHRWAVKEKMGGRDSEAVGRSPGLCLEPECVDPAEPGWGDLTTGRGFDASLGTSVKGLGLLSLEGLTRGTGLRRPPWPPGSYGSYLSRGAKENKRWCSSTDGRAPSAEGRPELPAAALPFLRKRPFLLTLALLKGKTARVR